MQTTSLFNLGFGNQVLQREAPCKHQSTNLPTTLNQYRAPETQQNGPK